MARMLLLLSVTIIIGSFAFSQTETFNHPELFEKYYKDIQNFGIPIEGSSAERQIYEYVAAQARSHGYTSTWQSITSEHDYHSFASNLKITIPGNQAKSIVLLFPQNVRSQPIKGNEDDAFLGSAFACLLMDQLSKLDVPQTIIIEFLGAEDGGQPGLGSRNFIEKNSRDTIAMAVCIDYSTTAQAWELIHGGDGKVSPAWLFELGLKVLPKAGMDISVNSIESQLYRLSLASPNLLAPFLRAGYPAIQIRPQENSRLLGKSESSHALLSAIIDLVTNYSKQIRESTNTHSWDANYIFVNLAGYRIISEQIIAIVFLTSMVAYLLLIFLKRADRHRYMRSLRRNFPAFLLMLLGCFAAFVVDTLLCLPFLPAYSVDPVYQQTLPLFFVGKLLTGLAIMLGLVFWFRRSLPGQSSFHAAAAFLASLSALVVVATISLTVSVYLMAVTLFISLGNLSRSRILKIICFLLSALCILQPVFEALRLHPGFQLDRLLLRSLFPGAVLMTLMAVPFVFLWCRVSLFLPLHRTLFRKVEVIVIVGLFLVGLFILIGSTVTLRVKADGIADLVVVREINQETGDDFLQATGASLLPPGAFNYESQILRLPFNREFHRLMLKAPVSDAPIFTQSTRNFLGRKSLQLQISSPSGIANLELHFTADQELIVHSLNFPYRYLDARNIQIQIGKNPPPVILLELTIPLDVSGSMQITTDLPDHLVFQPDNGLPRRIESIVRYKSRILWD